MIKNNELKPNEMLIVHVESEIEDIIPGYLENRRKDIKLISEALERDDYETIRILGHTIKGSGGGYGFDAITNIGRCLEQAAKNKNSEEVRKWVDKLLTYLEHVEVVYD